MKSLSGLRVLEWTSSVGGEFCGQLFARAGAEVWKLEPSASDLQSNGNPRDRSSALFAFLNAGKLSLSFDQTAWPASARLATTLLPDMDVFIASRQPKDGFLEELTRRERVVSVLWEEPPSPVAEAAEELIAYARSGAASVNGRPGFAPLKGVGEQAGLLSGIAAFIGAGASLHERTMTGCGNTLRVSRMAALLSTFAPSVLAAQHNGEPPAQKTGGFPSGPMETLDGSLVITVSRSHFWRDAMNALGLEELAASAPGYDPMYRQESYAAAAPRVAERVAGWHAHDLFELLGTLRITAGKVMSTADALSDPHVVARMEDAREGPGPVRLPPFRMSRTPLDSTLKRPPRLGEHTADALTPRGPSLPVGGEQHTEGGIEISASFGMADEPSA